jgi:hypothetical protein
MTKILHADKALRTRTEILDQIDLLLPGQMIEIDGRVLSLVSHTPAFFDGKSLRAEDRTLYGVIDAMLAGGSARSLPDAVKKLDLAGYIKGNGLNPQVRRTRVIEHYKADREKITERVPGLIG